MSTQYDALVDDDAEVGIAVTRYYEGDIQDSDFVLNPHTPRCHTTGHVTFLTEFLGTKPLITLKEAETKMKDFESVTRDAKLRPKILYHLGDGIYRPGLPKDVQEYIQTQIIPREGVKPYDTTLKCSSPYKSPGQKLWCTQYRTHRKSITRFMALQLVTDFEKERYDETVHQVIYPRVLIKIGTGRDSIIRRPTLREVMENVNSKRHDTFPTNKTITLLDSIHDYEMKLQNLEQQYYEQVQRNRSVGASTLVTGNDGTGTHSLFRSNSTVAAAVPSSAAIVSYPVPGGGDASDDGISSTTSGSSAAIVVPYEKYREPSKQFQKLLDFLKGWEHARVKVSVLRVNTDSCLPYRTTCLHNENIVKSWNALLLQYDKEQSTKEPTKKKKRGGGRHARDPKNGSTRGSGNKRQKTTEEEDSMNSSRSSGCDGCTGQGGVGGIGSGLGHEIRFSSMAAGSDNDDTGGKDWYDSDDHDVDGEDYHCGMEFNQEGWCFQDNQSDGSYAMGVVEENFLEDKKDGLQTPTIQNTSSNDGVEESDTVSSGDDDTASTPVIVNKEDVPQLEESMKNLHLPKEVTEDSTKLTYVDPKTQDLKGPTPPSRAGGKGLQGDRDQQDTHTYRGYGMDTRKSSTTTTQDTKTALETRTIVTESTAASTRSGSAGTDPTNVERMFLEMKHELDQDQAKYEQLKDELKEVKESAKRSKDRHEKELQEMKDSAKRYKKKLGKAKDQIQQLLADKQNLQDENQELMRENVTLKLEQPVGGGRA